MDIDYTLDTVIALLFNRRKIEEIRFYKGNINACDMLIDIDTILSLAKLTDRQRAVLDLYCTDNLSQEQVAVELGVTQQMVDKHFKVVKKKIEAVLLSWNSEGVLLHE